MQFVRLNNTHLYNLASLGYCLPINPASPFLRYCATLNPTMAINPMMTSSAVKRTHLAHLTVSAMAWLLALGLAANLGSMRGVYLFTRRVFRPDSAAARTSS